jgi:hypothetical protein
VQMVFLYMIFNFHEAIQVWRSRTPDGVQCAHFPSVITIIINGNEKVQMLKPLDKRELYTT